MKITKKALKYIIKEELTNHLHEQFKPLITIDSNGNVYKGDGKTEPLGLNLTNYEKASDSGFEVRNQFIKDLKEIDDDLAWQVGKPTAGPVVRLPNGKLLGVAAAAGQFAKPLPKQQKPELKSHTPEKYKDQSVIDELLAIENDDQALDTMVKNLLNDPKYDITKISSDPRIMANKKIKDWISGTIYAGAEMAYRKRKGPGTYVGD